MFVSYGQINEHLFTTLFTVFFAGYSSVLIVCHIMPQNAIYSSGLDAKARSLAKTWFTWVNTPEQNGTAIFLPSQILNFEGKQCPGALDGRFWRLKNAEDVWTSERNTGKTFQKSVENGEPLGHPPLSGQLRWELWHCTSTPRHQDGPSRWWCWYPKKDRDDELSHYHFQSEPDFLISNLFKPPEKCMQSWKMRNRLQCLNVLDLGSETHSQ